MTQEQPQVSTAPLGIALLALGGIGLIPGCGWPFAAAGLVICTVGLVQSNRNQVEWTFTHTCMVVALLLSVAGLGRAGYGWYEERAFEDRLYEIGEMRDCAKLKVGLDSSLAEVNRTLNRDPVAWKKACRLLDAYNKRFIALRCKY